MQTVITNGGIAVATARKPESLSFEGTNQKNYLALKIDVTQDSDIQAAFKETISKFGRVDVVVNNAGYGLGGSFEELSDAQIKTQMDINFFGLLAVTRKAMEVMREQKPSGGLIQQVTSIGGQKGVPLFSIYCASKWAVEGFTEAVLHEVEPERGIKFTCVEPGGFRYAISVFTLGDLPWLITCRTDWAGRSMSFPDKRHPAYDHLNAKEAMQKHHGSQKGDPKKGAEAIYELATLSDPPLRVVLGSDAYEAINGKIKAYGEN